MGLLRKILEKKLGEKSKTTWHDFFREELQKPYFAELDEKVTRAYRMFGKKAHCVSCGSMSRNILKELEADCGIARTKANLTDWAEQWVFLLNTVLTVEEGKANSHAGHGWEAFARNALHYVIEKNNGDVAGILWGKPAQTYKDLFDEDMVVVSPHPSPGGQPFSKTNELLRKRFLPEIQWG